MKNIQIELKVKTYVAHFLNREYGNPVILDVHLHQEFRSRLRKPEQIVPSDAATYAIYKESRLLAKPDEPVPQRDKVLSLDRYPDTVKILISEDELLRYGHCISNIDIIAFGKIIEKRAKAQALYVINSYRSVMEISEAIIKFQNEFNYSEDIWPFESIRKLIQRTPMAVPDIKQFYKDFFSEKISENFMEKMSQARDKYFIPQKNENSTQ